MFVRALRGHALRVSLAAVVAFVFGTVAVLSISTFMPTASVAQSTEDLGAEGLAANTAWWNALVAGTPDAVGAVLAPEFQIMRSDGTSYDRAAYLAGGIPKVEAMPEFSDMAVARHGDLLVTRYYVSVGSERDGDTVRAYAPRLTVFRKDGDQWLVSAHGNFAALDK